MEIASLGFSSFKIKGKSAVVVTDPFDPEKTGLKFPRTEADIVTVSSEDHKLPSMVSGFPMVIDGPGEYEVKGVEMIVIRVDAKNLIFHFKIDNLILVHLGKLAQKLGDREKELLNGADILMIPVGGGDFLSAESASQVISQIEPSVIIPMSYKTGNLNQAMAEKLSGVELFLKQMGKAEIEPQPKFNITRDKLPAEQTIVVLE
ncbi:MAG: hypothetical protein UV73_C0009G0016 [Candidatus Gottesmanbacteria bacterium GW2011_GWA2_43_14]|uniref:Zn-dependent hydrolase of the beta-lactamase fold-like protein n=1 Tax=Candidatus Gottesmanbacteria bacterium GW2011_GWA2_43_14 TaxID=1618443 RepID=A0A0G1DFK7_9BACT|nr:MAG: hypothetical protein UV73_C0009G0016 [Candidatus Gottesmanbacteria bacterium GW2011_GWA2_43_14]